MSVLPEEKVQPLLIAVQKLALEYGLSNVVQASGFIAKRLADSMNEPSMFIASRVCGEAAFHLRNAGLDYLGEESE